MINVVYHCAGMGNWQDVVAEQFDSLRKSGLTCIYATHVGEGVHWFREQALRQGIDMKLVFHSDNLLIAEYKAMLVVEHLAHTSADPVLYFHTKGVSHYDQRGRGNWRRLMQQHVIEDWQTNYKSLEQYDAIGVNWLPCTEDVWVAKKAWMRPHFSGNFWMARSEWLRKLPPYGMFHHELGPIASELWIGAAPKCCYLSRACFNQPFWEPHFDWERLEMPRLWDEMRGETIQ